MITWQSEAEGISHVLDRRRSNRADRADILGTAMVLERIEIASKPRDA